MEICPCDSQGFLDLERLEGSLRRKQTKLVGVCQASNVTGTIQDLKSVSEISHRYGAKLLVDAAQSAGVIDLDVKKLGIDLLAFTGHKGLLGPQGVGGLYLAEGVELEPLVRGGTGSRSDSEFQPDFLPDKYESGTLNAIGIHALSASLDFVRRRQREIAEAEKQLTGYFLQKARRIGGLRLYGPADMDCRTSVVSFNLEGLACSEVSRILDQEYGILCRPGLHCAPLAHKTIGTFPVGTVRFSFGFFNVIQQLDHAILALERITAGHGT